MGVDNFWVHIFNILLSDDETGETLRIQNCNVDSWHRLSAQQVGWELSGDGEGHLAVVLSTALLVFVFNAEHCYCSCT